VVEEHDGSGCAVHSEPFVCVLTLSWNDAENTIEFLRSVRRMDYDRYSVVVVDNGSSADTVEAIRAAFPEVELIAVGRNLGFGGGANVGFERAQQLGVDYVLFINNDTVVHCSLVRELVRAAHDHPRAGVLVPRIYYHEDPRRVWAAGARLAPFPPRVKMIGRGRRDHARYSRPRSLEYATGCALLIRREALEAVGGFDPVYWPAYQEDYDFSARVVKAGWEIWYVPAATLTHKETRSGQRTGARTKAYNLGKNTVPLYLRHMRFPLASLWAYVAWVVARETLKLNWRFVGPFMAGVGAGWARHRSEGHPGCRQVQGEESS
jgi:GT2 family glycosyltransferase